MFYKLAARNVVRSMKDYFIYFLTLSLGVCLFYVFNSTQSQSVMLTLNDTQADMLLALSQIMNFISIFISFILGFLILYANNFLIKRRKKELGLYLTLGMKKSHVSRMIIMETILIGLLAFVVGISAGVLLSQVVTVFTANLFEVELKVFTFIFSLSALMKAAVYFGLIFLCVIIFNFIIVNHYKIIDLIQGGRKNEVLKERSLRVSVCLFMLSLICLWRAYDLILNNGFLILDNSFNLCLLLGIIGTFLFFFSLSGFLLRFIQGRKKLYYRNLNMFVLRQIHSKINTTFVSMTLICLMLLLSMGSLCTGLGLSNALSVDALKTAPYHISITRNNPDTSLYHLLEETEKQGFNLSQYFESTIEMNVFNLDQKIMNYLPEELLDTEKHGSSIHYMTIDYLRLSEVNALLEAHNEDPLILNQGEYLILSQANKAAPAVKNFLDTEKQMEVNGHLLRPAHSDALDMKVQNGEGGANGFSLIVHDEVLQGLIPQVYILNANYINDRNVTEELVRAELIAMMELNPRPYDYFDSQVGTITDQGGTKLVVGYIVIYIGLVFLICSAAVLALQQLSESSDNARRYALLRKIGVDQKMIHHSLLLQIGIYFMMPLALAIVHTIVGVTAANQTITEFGSVDIMAQVFLILAVLLVVYGGYFLVTYFSAKAMIQPKRIR